MRFSGTILLLYSTEFHVFKTKGALASNLGNNNMTEVLIFDTLRTPLGKGNDTGALFEVRPIDLLSKCL